MKFIDCINRWRLSETAKAIIYLWQTDRHNWMVGTHCVVHQKTGVAIWTANSVYGIKIYYNVPDLCRKRCFCLGGIGVELKSFDRTWIYNIIVRNVNVDHHKNIQRKISDWVTDKIENKVAEKSYANQ